MQAENKSISTSVSLLTISHAKGKIQVRAEFYETFDLRMGKKGSLPLGNFH